MTIMPIQLPPGLERNATAYDTPDRWWDMNGVRWESGTLKPVGGWQRITSVPLTTAARRLHVWRANDETRHILAGCDGAIYSEINGTWYDVSPASFVPLSDLWGGAGYGVGPYGDGTYGTPRAGAPSVPLDFTYFTFGQWGEDIIWTANSDGRVLYYDTSAGAGTSTSTAVAGAPSSVHGLIVTEERHVMLFGGTPSGEATHSPYEVFWSSREDYTDWVFTSVTNTAGRQILNTMSTLRKGVLVREGVLIFSDSAVFLGEYVGQPFVYKFTKISDTQLMNPDSIAVFNGRAVWLSRAGWQAYSGGVVQSIECPIMSQIRSEMCDTYAPFRIHASHNGIFPEIWTYYPVSGETECSRYVIWNYAENTWAWGSLARSAAVEASSYRRPFMAAPSGHVYEHEYGWTDAGASRVGTIWIESGALGLGAGDRCIEVNQVMIANGYGADSLSVTLYGRFTPEGTEYTYGPYTPRSDGYVDTRGNGRQTRIRIDAAEDGEWSVGPIFAEVTQGAGR